MHQTYVPEKVNSAFTTLISIQGSYTLKLIQFKNFSRTFQELMISFKEHVLSSVHIWQQQDANIYFPIVFACKCLNYWVNKQTKIYHSEFQLMTIMSGHVDTTMYVLTGCQPKFKLWKILCFPSNSPCLFQLVQIIFKNVLTRIF